MTDPEYRYHDEHWQPIPNVVSGWSAQMLAESAADDFWNNRDGWEIGPEFNLTVRDNGVETTFAITVEFSPMFSASEVP